METSIQLYPAISSYSNLSHKPLLLRQGLYSPIQRLRGVRFFNGEFTTEKMGKWSLKHVETNQHVDQIVDFARETEENTYFFFSTREMVISDNIWDFNQKTGGVRNKNKNHVIQRQ